LTGRVRWYAVLAVALATAFGALAVFTIVEPLNHAEKQANSSQKKLEGATFAAPCRRAFVNRLSLKAVDKDPQCSLQFFLGIHNRCAAIDFPPVCKTLLGNPPNAVTTILRSRGQSLKGVVPGGGNGNNPSGQPGPPSGGSAGGTGGGGSSLGGQVGSTVGGAVTTAQQAVHQTCTQVNQLGVTVPC
jgi:uncharacterized membrane protein YgcG